MRAMKSWLPIAAAIVGRPDLWRTLVVQARRMVPSDWWRQPPFLPIPPANYVRFRMETAFGSDADAPPAAEMVHFLEWCRGR